MGVLTSRPAAFAIFFLYGVVWLAFDHGLELDTQAIHAKLDELLKVNGDSNDELMSIDDKDAEEVERERTKVRAS